MRVHIVVTKYNSVFPSMWFATITQDSIHTGRKHSWGKQYSSDNEWKETVCKLLFISIPVSVEEPIPVANVFYDISKPKLNSMGWEGGVW